MNTMIDTLKQEGSFLYNVLFSVILIAVAIAVGLAFHALLIFLLKRRRNRLIVSGIGRGLSFDRLANPLRSLIPAICVYLIEPVHRFTEGMQVAFFHLVDLWIIGSIAWLASASVLVARDKILSNYDLSAKDDLLARSAATQIRVIERLLIVVIIFIAAAFMLTTFTKVRQIGISLLASAGVAGIILGLAAQKTLGNVLAGLQIAFAQPIRLGDVVVVESEMGRIEEITLTYIVVCMWDLRRLILPISYFVEHPFQNWTRRTADILGTVLIYTDYTTPVEEIRGELTRILEQSTTWDRKVNSLQATNATERTVELRALISAADSSALWDLRCEVREKLLAFLQKRFPENLPRLRVQIDKDMPYS